MSASRTVTPPLTAIRASLSVSGIDFSPVKACSNGTRTFARARISAHADFLLTARERVDDLKNDLRIGMRRVVKEKAVSLCGKQPPLPFAVADQVRPDPLSRAPRPQMVWARISIVDLPPLGAEEMKSAAFVAGQLKKRAA